MQLREVVTLHRHLFLKLQSSMKLDTVLVVICPFMALLEDALFAVLGLNRIELDDVFK
ncbi:hypothetical protein ILUMI_15590, partial [Ignelater luminosus]